MMLINNDTGERLGMYRQPRAAKVKLAIIDAEKVKVYATFQNEWKALEFMKRLSEFVGVEK